ncbi:MAG: hypothetical protein WCP52_04295, partial [Bacteroidota bacterium]
MKRIFFLYIIPFLFVFIAGFTTYQLLIHSDFVNNKIKLEIVLDASQQGKLQLFIEDENEFKASVEHTSETIMPSKEYHLEIEIPITEKPGRIRIDPGFTRGEWKFKKITLKGISRNIVFNADSIFQKFKPANDIKTFSLEKDGVLVVSNGQDPYIISTFNLKNYFKKLNEKPFLYPL